MNREQRRQAQRGRVAMFDLRQIPMPPDMRLDEIRLAVTFRLQINREETRHPFHHKTANGAIVEPDPTLEYLLGRLPDSERTEILLRWEALPDAPPTIPVNRTFYGVDPYAQKGH